MNLDHRTKELIAVGTWVGANCHVCLQCLVGKAREQGIPEDEIAEAIEVGKRVCLGAQGKIFNSATDLLGQTPDKPAAVGCGCKG